MVAVTDQPPEPFNLSASAAAAVIGVHEDTIKRWAAAGELHAIRTPGGWWRFRRSDLDAYLAQGGTRVQETPA